MKSFDPRTLSIGEELKTSIITENHVHQDGTTPLYRDVDGRLWAMSGHSHIGQVCVFCGTCLDDLEPLYPITTNFCVGNADYAFSGIRYPEGVKARGSIWPFGLYICPGTHRFFCFFHNETGWNGNGTAYDAFGYCDTPAYDSDFRHVGLMHSDDEGRTWVFDRWVLAAEKPCFTEMFHPERGSVRGQEPGIISLGSGDFTLYVEPDGPFMYLLYNVIRLNTETGVWYSCDMYMARARKRDDGMMGDFVKYYDGSFSESGIFGKESVVVPNAWHARMVYLKEYGKYLLSYVPVHGNTVGYGIYDKMALRVGDDMLHWGEEIPVLKDGEPFGSHYCAVVPDEAEGSPFVLEKDTFSILINHNGTNVRRFRAHW